MRTAVEQKMRGSNIIQALIIISVSALTGFAITRVEPTTFENTLLLTLGGGLLATIAILLVGFFLRAPRLHPVKPMDVGIGMKVGFTGFCIALFGVLVGFIFPTTLGFVAYIIVASGVFFGFVGIVVGYAMLIAKFFKK